MNSTARAPGAKKVFKRRGQFMEVWHRLKKNKLAVAGLVVLALLILLALFAEQIAPYFYDDQNISVALTPPGENPDYILGTDNLGRDILSRLIYGAQISLQVGLIAMAISVAFGVVFGAIAGYFGGRIDNIIMRVMDIMLAIPGILLAIAIAATLGPGMTNAIISVGISGVPSMARVVRSSVLSVREMEYIEAAHAMNASHARIIIKHILPNVLAPIIVQATLGIANAILQACSLSFLGLGVQPPVPEWGAMISNSRPYLRDYSYMVTLPGLAIMITVFAINLLGDGLRDALDPKLKQ
jgi:peptide/nickel transport system permease protein